MKKSGHDEVELQKNRLEILKMSGKSAMIHAPEDPSDNLYAWEYELEFYKKLKRRERFYIFGSTCGIASLILVILLEWQKIISLFLK